MKKRVFYREISYVAGIIFMAFGAAFTELADFGMSMVVAPAYILHLKISEFFPAFTFGVSEYCVQGLIIIIMVLIVRRFRLHYLFSFATAIIYGMTLDLVMHQVSFLPDSTFILRIIWFSFGTVFCAVAVSLFFHTYLSPESYELIIKEIAQKFSLDISKVKTSYDFISTAVSVILSFSFFGFGVFRGIGIGTIICTLVNGVLIGKISALLEKKFSFKDRFNLQKYFR